MRVRAACVSGRRWLKKRRESSGLRVRAGRTTGKLCENVRIDACPADEIVGVTLQGGAGSFSGMTCARFGGGAGSTFGCQGPFLVSGCWDRRG